MALAGRDARNRDVAIESTLPAGPGPRLTTGLGLARPNPFTESVALAFSLASRGPVELSVFGVDGRRVRTLVRETRDAGTYEAIWDGRDDHGAILGAGVYYARLVTPHGRFARRVTNLR
jgi:hypothetical protein